MMLPGLLLKVPPTNSALQPSAWRAGFNFQRNRNTPAGQAKMLSSQYFRILGIGICFSFA
jgi:hypothetical protein